VHDDEFAHLRGSLRRSTNLRVAQEPPQPRVVEPFAPMGRQEPPRRRLSFWQITLRAIPIVAALVSTSLLVYFMFFGSRSGPLAQSQQEQRDSVAQAEPQQPQQEKEPSQRMAQPAEQPAPEPEQPPIPTDLGPRLPMPSDDKLVVLITSSILALNQANATGNYTVLRDGAAPAFQRINTPERLAQIFSNLRARNLDLSPVVLFTPKLFRRPEMNGEGMIRITGFFPTEPQRVNFDLVYQPVQGKWRLFGIAVETGVLQPPGGPQAQQKTAPPAPKREETSPEAADAEKPPMPPRKNKPKPKPADDASSQSSNTQAAKPNLDVRDRIEQPPASPSPAKPKQKSIWNPFGR